MNKSFVVSFIFLASVSFVSGQTPAQPDVIPPSPQAASLGKYAQIPVNYNTGTPQIDIPLHTIAVNDMQLPISLSYHASGIKVEEIASWVGLGWNLNANGAITRVMRGKPDESTNGYFNRGQWDTWQTMKTWATGPPVLGVVDQASQKHDFQFAVASGEKDLQPDVFYFNFAGYSGRIYFDIDKKPVIIPFQDLKIDHPFAAGKTEWVISTPDGLEFVFKNSDAEWTTPLGDGSYSPPFYSTWYVSEIRSVKQPGFIRFTYTSLTLSGIETTPNAGIVVSRTPPNLTCELDPPYPSDMGSSEYSIITKYLEQIQFPDGSIFFSSSNDRQDSYGSVTYNGRKLNGIAVMSGTIPNVKTVKTFQFTYDYFGTGTAKRLRLLKVQEVGKNPYQFGYNGTTLPAPTSLSRDYWGYYNGASNSSLMPALSTDEAAQYQSHPLAAANRAPHAQNMKAAILEQITWPTMGYTRFNFEPHTYYGPTFVTGGTSAYVLGATTSTMNSYELGLKNYYVAQQTAYLGGPISVKSSTFTLAGPQYVTFSTIKSISGAGSIGNIAETFVFKGPTINYNTPVCHDCTGRIYLDAGTYVVLSAASQSGVSVLINASYPTTVTQNNIVGGVRIASIENFDGVTSYFKNFKYNSPPLANKSYGTLFTQPLHKKVTPCGNLYVSAYDLTNSSFEGSHIGYDQVEVIDENNENGKTIYKFRNDINDITRSLPKDEMYFKANGDTVKRVTYKYNFDLCLASGGTIRCAFASLAPAIKMDITKHRITRSGIYIVSDYYEFDVSTVSNSTFFTYQSEIIEKTFSQENYPDFLLTKKTISSGKEVIESYKDSHTLPTQIIQTQTTGEKLIEKFYNSPEELGGTMAFKTPIRHIFIREINGQQFLTNAQLYQYQNNLLTRMDVYEASSPVNYTEGMTITYNPKFHHTYNTSKKMVERYPAGGVRSAFIWDSYNINPIAEVTNSGGGVVAFTSFENSSDEGNWVFTLNGVTGAKTGEKCHSFTAQTITRGILSTSTTYKVSYWAKNGVPVVTNVTASNDAANPDAQGWKYYEKTISGTAAITISAVAGTLIDELRLYPATAMMKSLTYKPFVGISTVNDANNQIQYFEYDPIGRLVLIKDFNGNIIQHHSYNYKN